MLNNLTAVKLIKQLVKVGIGDKEISVKIRFQEYQ